MTNKIFYKLLDKYYISLDKNEIRPTKNMRLIPHEKIVEVVNILTENERMLLEYFKRFLTFILTIKQILEFNQNNIDVQTNYAYNKGAGLYHIHQNNFE
jgi:hypothetical protein